MSQIFGHLWARRARLYRAAPGAGGGAPAGPVLATIPATGLAVRIHPEFITPAVSGGRLVSATDLTGVHGLAEAAAGTGPKVMTHGAGAGRYAGLKVWRFDVENSGEPDIVTEGLRISEATFTTAAASYNRNMTYWFVVRIHRMSGGTSALWNFTVAGGALRTNGPNVAIAATANMVRGTSAQATDGRLCAGAQLQVIGINSSATGQRIFINGTWQDIAAAGAQTAGYAGAIIAAGTCGMDLHEAVIYTTSQSVPDAIATRDALMAAHNIVDYDTSLAGIGDSITAGFKSVNSGVGAAMRMAEVGPPNWRFLNYGASGNQCADIVARATANMASYHASLRNIMSMQIGYNDFAGGGRTAAAVYNGGGVGTNNHVELTKIWLAAGYYALHTINIACAGAGPFAKIDAIRAMHRDPAFLTDTLAGVGQAYDGKLRVMDTALIQDAGAVRYDTQANAGDATYYDPTDGIHTSIYGAGPLWQSVALDAVAWLGA